MNLTIFILIALIGIEHILFAGLEIFASPKRQASAFDMDEEFLNQDAARVALSNQGIYNFALGAMIIATIFIFTGLTFKVIAAMLLCFVFIVGIFGGFTATRKIFLVQALPAFIVLIMVIFLLKF
ncbi:MULTISPECIES: DUF1304 domain-containing protein [Lactobacillaceae]|uniref:DUF1304 domain-containing protein n=1 Tax=Lactobacillaceae TaxID=33958 RepID=UPI000C1B7137|nr:MULTISPECIES: DUF1304 domain-containing protein [Lactobacillaceae]